MPQKSNRRTAERRRSPRVDARLSMRVEGAPAGEGAAQLVTESQNISVSGVYCLSPHFLAPLSKVNLTLVLPEFGPGRGANEFIKCEGIVVRCEPFGTSRSERRYQLACMFSDLNRAHRALLADYVTWRNLQSLRAAARAANGTNRPARRAAAKPATRRAPTARTATKKAAARRRTVH